MKANSVLLFIYLFLFDHSMQSIFPHWLCNLWNGLVTIILFLFLSINRLKDFLFYLDFITYTCTLGNVLLISLVSRWNKIWYSQSQTRTFQSSDSQADARMDVSIQNGFEDQNDTFYPNVCWNFAHNTSNSFMKYMPVWECLACGLFHSI